MRSPLLLSITAAGIAVWSAAAVGQALILPVPTGTHPYDTALNYCAERGGLARYSVTGKTVKFSCGEAPASVVIIVPRG